MFTIFGFYKFQKINNLKKNQKILNNLLVNKNIYGSIIVSEEGLNGSISGKNKDIKATIIKLKKIFSIKEFDSFNNSKSKFKPFHKSKVKIKKEVVPMDLKISNKIKKKNTRIEPTKWNELVKDKKNKNTSIGKYNFDLVSEQEKIIKVKLNIEKQIEANDLIAKLQEVENEISSRN